MWSDIDVDFVKEQIQVSKRNQTLKIALQLN